MKIEPEVNQIKFNGKNILGWHNSVSFALMKEPNMFHSYLKHS